MNLLELGPNPATLVAVVTQQSNPPSTDQGGQGEDFGKSTPVGFVLLLVLLVAVVFLVRSMTKHLRRVPASFDQPAPQDTKPE